MAGSHGGVLELGVPCAPLPAVLRRDRRRIHGLSVDPGGALEDLMLVVSRTRALQLWQERRPPLHRGWLLPTMTPHAPMEGNFAEGSSAEELLKLFHIPHQ